MQPIDVLLNLIRTEDMTVAVTRAANYHASGVTHTSFLFLTLTQKIARLINIIPSQT